MRMGEGGEGGCLAQWHARLSSTYLSPTARPRCGADGCCPFPWCRRDPCRCHWSRCWSWSLRSRWLRWHSGRWCCSSRCSWSWQAGGWGVGREPGLCRPNSVLVGPGAVMRWWRSARGRASGRGRRRGIGHARAPCQLSAGESWTMREKEEVAGRGRAWEWAGWRRVVVVVQDRTRQNKTRPWLVERVESLVVVVGSGGMLPAAGPSPEVVPARRVLPVAVVPGQIQIPIPIGADDGPGRASACAACTACAACASPSPTLSAGTRASAAAASAMYTGSRSKEGSPFWACFYYLGAHPNFYGAPS